MQLLIGGAVALVVLVGGYFFLSDRPAEDAMMNDTETGETMEKDEMTGDTMNVDVMMEGDAMMDAEGGDGAMNDSMQKGSYEAYSPEKLALANEGDVVLFFNASWCPLCKATDADIKANLSAIPSGLTILSVDYDSSTELKQKYGITYQHTFVQVNADGSQIKKWSGSPTLAALAAEIQ